MMSIPDTSPSRQTVRRRPPDWHLGYRAPAQAPVVSAGRPAAGQADPVRQARAYVLCTDGTHDEIGVARPTNPAAVYEMLSTEHPREQLTFYDPGVGTMASPSARGAVERWVSRMGGLAFGWGLKENVAQAYTFLMQRWQPGDEIYLFGFSRGAYTARVLAGMLCRVGLLRPGSENLVPYAVARYARSARPGADEAAVRRFSDALCWGTEREMLSPGLPGEVAVHAVPIRYLGLWDTVDATGLLRPDRLRWPDADTLANVQTIRHAVSIDERRRPYRECLVAAGHPDAQEVWFSGVHCDVGGTPPEHELSTVALKWVVDGAVEGLRLRTGAYGWRCHVAPDYATAAVHRNGSWWRLAGTRVRPIPPTAWLHETVRLRREADAAYLPALPWTDGVERWADRDWRADGQP